MKTENLKQVAAAPRARKLRSFIVRHINEHVPTKKVAVLLSGGVDSHAVLFGALEAGKTPHVYSFTLEGNISRDFIAARRTADAFGLEFTPIELPTDIEGIQEYVWQLHHNWMQEFYLSKTTIECCWPVMHAIDNILLENYVLTGFGGDIPYCSARSAKKRYLAGEFDQYMKEAYKNMDETPQAMFRALYMGFTGAELKFVSPFEDRRMLKLFSKFDPFKEGNKPIQKAISRAAFIDYFSHEEVKVYGQQPFQKGDSGIEKLFENLTKTNWLIRGSTVKSVYNAVARKEVEPPKKTFKN